jgi:hypothetical protein
MDPNLQFLNPDPDSSPAGNPEMTNTGLDIPNTPGYTHVH